MRKTILVEEPVRGIASHAMKGECHSGVLLGDTRSVESCLYRHQYNFNIAEKKGGVVHGEREDGHP